MYMYLPDMKFLWAMLSLGQLYTDDNTNDNDNDDDTNDDDNDTQRTNHDCIGSLAYMPMSQKQKDESGVKCARYISSRLSNAGIWNFKAYTIPQLDRGLGGDLQS